MGKIAVCFKQCAKAIPRWTEKLLSCFCGELRALAAYLMASEAAG
jgi:hypothetical protein